MQQREYLAQRLRPGAWTSRRDREQAARQYQQLEAAEAPTEEDAPATAIPEDGQEGTYLAHLLRPGAWIGRSDREEAERRYRRPAPAEPCAVTTTPAVEPVELAEAHAAPAASASGETFEHITMDGTDPGFFSKTREALELLREAPSWELMKHIRTIRQTEETSENSSGYVSGDTIVARRTMWDTDPYELAGSYAHEGSHASRGAEYSTEEERLAFGDEAQALKEIGAPSHLIAAARAHQRNPTHHIAFAREWGWDVDEAGRLVAPRAPHPPRCITAKGLLKAVIFGC
jgi:hypothetical protein